MRKNALKYTCNDEVLSQLQQAHNELFSEQSLDTLARETKFQTRKRKISASSFLKALVFNEENQERLTLSGLKCELMDQKSTQVSQQAIHKRFTDRAVCFLKAVLSKQLTSLLSIIGDSALKDESPFTAICIKDSTKFRLPASYAKDYPSFKGRTGDIGLMNIQYEFDLLCGNSRCLEFTKATRNDQTDARETVDNIQQGSLNIRDLGYITLIYLKGVVAKGAYYLNRLPKINVYQFINNEYQLLDWKKIDKKMQTHRLERLELEVFLGAKDKLKTRMILVPVPQEVREQRIKKAKKSGKRKGGYNVSKEYKIKAGYNIYITNTEQQALPAQQVHQTYRLRWQIELIFKTWKTNLEIDKIKSIKKERMECQLIARFIWILLNSQLFQISNCIIRNAAANLGCSHFKFFKRMKKLSRTLMTSLQSKETLIHWFKELILPLIDEFIIDKKKDKLTHPEILNILTNP